jgi:3-keto-5-aminohexanoate cleavage enzyme
MTTENTSMSQLIINAALTGMVPTKANNPHVPITIEEIVADARRSVDAGAAILHLHVRYRDGRPAYERDTNAALFAAVRAACPDVIISGSTSGRVVSDIDKRAAVLDAAPDMASLTLGSMNFATTASVNAPDTIRELARRMRARGVMPELEIFDLGMADYAHYLLQRKEIEAPLYANILLGSLGTLNASAANLAAVVGALPPGTTWAGAGIGRFQFFVNGLAIAMGGHVRVGLEDNIWMDPETKRQPATNARLIERTVMMARAHGRDIASCADARGLLRLPVPQLA